MTELTLNVNGENRRVAVRTGDTLLRVLREQLGLTGAKNGCENGDCGACTVLLGGKPVKACLVLAVEVADTAIRTIEGLRDHPVQRAFIEHQGFQCGFCTSGQILNAVALVESDSHPSDDKIETWMESNLCRCTGYEGIRRALKAVTR